MTTITELFDQKGPFASVALRTPSALDDAADQFRIRWKDAHNELARLGLDESELQSLEHTVREISHDDGGAVVVVKPADSPAFTESLGDDLTDDVAVLDSLPRIGAVLESRQRTVAHLVVVADRAGADILVVASDGTTETIAIDGETLHIHRGQPGGWSQQRFQQRAKNQWETNAAQIAATVAEVASEVDPRVICVAGDVRAVSFLHQHLPDRLEDLAVDLEGQSEELVAEESVRAAADVVARDIRSTLEQFREAASKGLAVGGAVETTRSLTEGRVDTLLVHDDPADERRGRFELDGMWCSASASDSEGLAPGRDSEEGRLVDIAIRSALQSDAEIRFVPATGGPDEGIGALLRW